MPKPYRNKVPSINDILKLMVYSPGTGQKNPQETAYYVDLIESLGLQKVKSLFKNPRRFCSRIQESIRVILLKAEKDFLNYSLHANTYGLIRAALRVFERTASLCQTADGLYLVGHQLGHVIHLGPLDRGTSSYICTALANDVITHGRGATLLELADEENAIKKEKIEGARNAKSVEEWYASLFAVLPYCWSACLLYQILTKAHEEKRIVVDIKHCKGEAKTIEENAANIGTWLFIYFELNEKGVKLNRAFEDYKNQIIQTAQKDKVMARREAVFRFVERIEVPRYVYEEALAAIDR